MDNKTITFLVIDDDEIDREVIRREFLKEKYSNPIIEFENGSDALEFLKSKDKEYMDNNPLIILLDLNMPKMGGLEFLEELRKDEKLKKIIVFVMSTSEDYNDKLKSYNLFIAGYTTKGKIQDGIKKITSMLDTFWKKIEMPPY
ncbi:MAG: two-component system response regulator [Planctomycetota bacterium]|nr:MAG: two-component system response regulator [Planctomycetota bacterium]